MVGRREFLIGAGAVAVVATLPKMGVAEQSVNTITAYVKQSVEIDGTGATNVSAELNAFFAGLPAGSVVDFPAGGRFRIDQEVAVRGKTDLTVNGNGAVFFTDDPTGDGSTLEAPSRDARTRNHFLVEGCANVTINNVVVRGAHPNGGIGIEAYVAALEGQHGFDVVSSSNVTLKDCRVTDVYGDFAYVGKGSAFVSILGLYGRRNGRQGIAVTQATDVLIEGCDLADVRRTQIDLEPNLTTDRVERVTLRGNLFGTKRLTWFSCGGRGFVGDVLVEGNTMNCPAQVLVNSSDGTRRGPFTFTENVSTVGGGNPQGAFWKFTDVDGINVHNNTIILQPNRDMYLVGVTNCTGIDVSGNTVPGGVGELKLL